MSLWSWRLCMIGLIGISAYGVWWLLPPPTSNPFTGVVQTQQIGELHVTLTLDHALPGTRIVDIRVVDSAGKPADINAVHLHFGMDDATTGFLCNLMPTAGASTTDLDAQRLTFGHFQARGSFFTMVGRWTVAATLVRPGNVAVNAPFTVAIAAPGEASGPLNPLVANPQTLAAGQTLYAAQCATCHGTAGRGDDPQAMSLNPRPANFTQHMGAGLHTDGQVYLWIRDGFPGSAMPAWGSRLQEPQIWQLVAYLRTFSQAIPSNASQATPVPTGAPIAALAAPSASQSGPVPDSAEPLPPLIFERSDNLWRSDGHGALRQLTDFHGAYIQSFSVAPDGRTIAYALTTPAPMTATTPLATSALWLMQADGTHARVVWQPKGGWFGLPSWTPDGQAVYVAVGGLPMKGLDQMSAGQFQIVRVDVATGNYVSVLTNALESGV